MKRRAAVTVLSCALLALLAAPAVAGQELPENEPTPTGREEAEALCIAGDLDAAQRALVEARQRHRILLESETVADLERQMAANWRKEAELLRGLALSEGDRQKLQTALRRACQAYASSAFYGDEPQEAEALLRTAEVQGDLGQTAAAADASQRAASLYGRHGDAAAAGEASLREADLRLNALDLPRAVSAAERALEHFETAGDESEVAGSAAGLALLQGMQGQPRSALPRFSVPSLPAERSHSAFEAMWLMGRALRLVLLGRPKAALRSLEQAEELARALEEDSTAVSRQMKAQFALRRGHVLGLLWRLRPAIAAYREARSLAGEIGNLSLLAEAWSAECAALAATAAVVEAEACREELMRSAAGVAPTSAASLPPPVPDSAETMAGLRRTFSEESGRLIDVVDSLSEAAELADRGEGREALRILDAIDPAALRSHEILDIYWHEAAGGAHAVAGRPEEAVHLLRRGRDQARGLVQSGLVTPAQKAQVLEVFAPVTQMLVGLLHELGRPGEALLEAEGGRAVAFLEALRAAGSAAEREGSSAALGARRAAVEEELAAVETGLRAADRDDRPRLLEQRASLDRRLSALRFEELLQQEAATPGVGFDAVGDLRRVADRVGPVLYYYQTREDMLAFLLLPGEREIHSATLRFPGGGGAEEERIEASNLTLANPIRRPLWTGAAHYIPFGPKLPPDGPLVIVPHGPLHEVAFAALMDDFGRALGERYRLTIAPSLAVLRQLADRRAAPREGGEGLELLAIASGRGLGLPLHEVGEVASRFDPDRVQVLASGQATVAAYRAAAPRARQILIASRAVASAERQRPGYVELAAGEGHDSRLTAADLAAIPLAAELVTLAACDTARSEPLLSDDQLDLARAFLLAGSASVLATRWKLPEDPRTSLFLQDFYRLYRSGGPDGGALRKDEALRRARILSRRRGDPAQIWAAWVLVGDGR